ncbi:ATP-dependent Clp protease ATP-binding subunit CLPT2 chloroplastic [Euphorbia peplus]|nr:ATP-dependent Clp protease ATP-binding subunit CLPT2 chloroplastic [Euphorbia peplus]
MAAQSLANLPLKTLAISQFNLHPEKPISQFPQFLKPYTFPNPSFLTLISKLPFSAGRPISATICSSLPTAYPERFTSAEKVPKWSWRAIKAFTMAQLEARKLKREDNGTESLLLGILIEGTSLAAKYLWTNGITVMRVREEIFKLFGKPDMYYFPPEQPLLAESAQRALDWAVNHKLKSENDGEITTSDLVLGIWSEVDSPGHKVLATLGFNDEKAKELESLSSGPGFVDG